MVREERFTLLMPMPSPRCCGSLSMTRLAPGVGELLAELQKIGARILFRRRITGARRRLAFGAICHLIPSPCAPAPHGTRASRPTV